MNTRNGTVLLSARHETCIFSYSPRSWKSISSHPFQTIWWLPICLQVSLSFRSLRCSGSRSFLFSWSDPSKCRSGAQIVTFYDQLVSLGLTIPSTKLTQSYMVMFDCLFAFWTFNNIFSFNEFFIVGFVATICHFEIPRRKIGRFPFPRPVRFWLPASSRVNEHTKHYNEFHILVIGSFPEIIKRSDGGLTKNGKYLAIN